MPTQPIEHKGYDYSRQRTRKPVSGAEFSLFPEQSSSRQEDSSGGGLCLHDRIRAMLAQVPRGADGLLSFQDLIDHHGIRQRAWTDMVLGNLQGSGVDVATRFRLTHDPASGQVTVAGEHPQASTVEEYFAANPIMIAEFEHILVLGKLVDLARRTLSSDELSQRLNLDVMVDWFCERLDSAALLSGGGMVLGLDEPVYTGLDIRI